MESTPPRATPRLSLDSSSGYTLSELIGIIAILCILCALIAPNIPNGNVIHHNLLDATRFRAFGQAWLAHDIDFPSEKSPADVYSLAGELARRGEITDPKIWFPVYDSAVSAFGDMPDSILDRASPPAIAPVNSRFQHAPLAIAIALLPNVAKLPPETPIAWTRGLKPDGNWATDAPYGDWGGLIFKAGGGERMYPGGIAVKLKSWGTGKPTSNIYEALPPETRISEYIPTPEVAKKMASIRRWAWLTDKTPASLFAPGVLLALACWLGFTHARRRTWETPVGIIILLGLACIWVFLD